MAILLLIFASQNMHLVSVRLIVGSPIDAPMILVISGAFIGGFAVSTFLHIVRVSKKGRPGEDEDE
ncbi:MAG: hypothetical protein HQL51_03625 [Magnetococcales bacterium]|nr:hypothetical protein [Magnetococcales bacterium]